MKTLVEKRTIVFSPFMPLLFIFFMLFAACNEEDEIIPDESYQSYQTVNLVSSVSGDGASILDPSLVNAWGMAVSPTGYFWIASTGRDVTTIYDYNGMTNTPPIPVSGNPTGVVYNPTLDFLMPSSNTLSKFIYVGEEGAVHVWASGSTTLKVADHSEAGSVFKGIAMGNDGESNFLYIANFSGGEIEVLDRNFVHKAGMPFMDPSLPPGYAPFNIKNIGGKLYVTYALHSADKHDDVPGAGHGYINIFNADGSFVRRFASGGSLNSPWGIAKVTNNFGEEPNAILIANAGDGRINVFSEDGEFLHALTDGSTTIEIDGLRDIMFPTAGVPSIEQTKLYFTAGPAKGTQGLFGYIKMR